MSGYMGHGKLLSGAVLDTIVPHASDANLEEALNLLLQDDAGDSPFLLHPIKQRLLLFFGRLEVPDPWKATPLTHSQMNR
jgi:hypothetical protein